MKIHISFHEDVQSEVMKDVDVPKFSNLWFLSLFLFNKRNEHNYIDSCPKWIAVWHFLPSYWPSSVSFDLFFHLSCNLYEQLNDVWKLNSSQNQCHWVCYVISQILYKKEKNLRVSLPPAAYVLFSNIQIEFHFHCKCEYS